MPAALAHNHDVQGRRKSARREDGTIWNYQYNTRSEVTGAEKRQSNSDLVPGLDFGYSYDGMGNRLSTSKGTPALVTEYEPDAMNRYANITSPGGDDILVKSDTPVDVEMDETPVTVTSSGDFRSARITATNTTAPAFPEISITGEDNFSESGHRWIPQATFSPTYDDDGNLTNDGRWIYTWDAMNRLVGMTPTTAALTAGVLNQTLSFAYDHLSRRIAKKVTTTNGEGSTVKDYRYLYEGWNVVAQFTADTSNTLTPDATYLWSLDLSGTFHSAGGVGGLHSVNLLSQSEGDLLCLACYDANGNIIAWTDGTGRVLQRQDYDPFGNRVIRDRLAIAPEQSDRLEYGFSTKPLDSETGFIYYIHRYYGPRHSQWLSHDPIEEAGGLNLYGFVGNAPIARYDIIGLDDNGYNPYIPGSFITSRSDFNPPPMRDLEIDRRNRDGGRAAGASAGDAEGKYLLDHYLTGGGRPLTITSWKAYMTADNAHTANPKYRQKLQKLLRDAASKRAGWTVGQSGPLNWAGHAEMANGEGMIGYEYLHGTNSFTIDGTITKKQDSSGKVIWEFDAHYNWKDDINKNNGYVTDIFKNMVAETITIGGATPYTVEIKFDSKSTMDACEPPASAKGQEWPFKSTP